MTTGWIVAYAVLWVAVVFVGITVLGLLRRVNAVLTEVEQSAHRFNSSPLGPPVGFALPEFEAHTPDGGLVHSSALRAHGAAVYLFISPGCAPCEAIGAQLRETGWQERVPLIMVTSDSTEGRRLAEGVTGVTVLLQHDHEISEAFQVRPTPYTVAMDDDSTVVVSRVPASAAQLRSIAQQSSRAIDSAGLVH